MVVIDCEAITKIILLYSVIIITFGFARKKINMKLIKRYKTIVIIFLVIFIAENVGLCLYITPDIIVKSGIEINNIISMTMSILIYISLALTVIIRVAIIMTLEMALSDTKYGCVIWGAFVLILVFYDLLNIIDMNVYILSCVIILGILNKYKMHKEIN